MRPEPWVPLKILLVSSWGFPLKPHVGVSFRGPLGLVSFGYLAPTKCFDFQSARCDGREHRGRGRRAVAHEPLRAFHADPAAASQDGPELHHRGLAFHAFHPFLSLAI